MIINSLSIYTSTHFVIIILDFGQFRKFLEVIVCKNDLMREIVVSGGISLSERSRKRKALRKRDCYLTKFIIFNFVFVTYTEAIAVHVLNYLLKQTVNELQISTGKNIKNNQEFLTCFLQTNAQ